MFTGLIQSVCTVRSATPRSSAGSMVIAVDLGTFAEQAKIGDSIAINGACLTVTELAGTVASFDASPETIAKSTLGQLRPSAVVNVELAMKATDRFGGHFVTGHIDGTATIKGIEKKGQFHNVEFSASPELLEQMISKGSVAVDGISLTIASLNQSSFRVAIIPKTLETTTLENAKAGQSVNIETDIIVKTIKGHVERLLGKEEKLTVEKLKQMGF